MKKFVKNGIMEKNNHIPDSEINQDILDTRNEIINHRAEIEILERNPLDNRTRIYLLQGRIGNKKDFINSLKNILQYRKDRKS
jgi:hypothetical protein